MVPRLLSDVTFKDIYKVILNYKEGHELRKTKHYVSYSGEMNKWGTFHGRGVLIISKKVFEKYEGSFKNGQFDGLITEYRNQGLVYITEFK